MDNNLAYTKKFLKSLGTVQDFVDYLSYTQSGRETQALSDFIGTKNGSRYLMIRKGDTILVVDFRHFFAAMSQRLEGKILSPNAFRGEGAVLMLGIANEMFQCMKEIPVMKINSCFSPEDLVSNRLGVEFAELVIIKKAERTQFTNAILLNNFLTKLNPVPANTVSQLKVSGYSNNFQEIVKQLFTGIFNVFVSKAY